MMRGFKIEKKNDGDDEMSDCEPLRGKRVECPEYLDMDGFDFAAVKSAVRGLIKYHEDKIKNMIEHIEAREYSERDINEMIRWIQAEYYAIQNIEEWFEDVING